MWTWDTVFISKENNLHPHTTYDNEVNDISSIYPFTQTNQKQNETDYERDLIMVSQRQLFRTLKSRKNDYHPTKPQLKEPTLSEGNVVEFDDE